MAASEKLQEASIVHPTAPIYAEIVGYSDSPHNGGSSSVISPRRTISKEKINDLRDNMRIPQGLAECIAKASEASARRYWIVDNSGSMNTPDGKRVLAGNKLVSCSRWQELGDSLKWHGQVASILGAHTEFQMLNIPDSLTTQTVVINSENSYSSLNELNSVINSSPGGLTPLCEALKHVIADITALAPELRASGRSVSVIIASDGQASDGNMNTVKATLAPLAHLPCDVIIRLCTDEDAVVQYWNDIDADLELNLDVLDDTGGEGKEVRALNPWIGYGEALQRIREFGQAPRIFDMMDERSLCISEAMDVVKFILGQSVVAHFPHPEVDGDEYLKELKNALSTMPPVFDASQNKMVPWIDLKTFATQVMKKSNVCVIS